MSGIGYSQPDWIVSGRVTDSLDTPLELAVVYTTPDTSERFLAFAYSDENGAFQLALPANEAKVWLHVKYLGYAPLKIAIARPVTEPLAIRLSPQENRLSEVIVSDGRPPIIERSDTTIYHVEDFTDSTEYNVEDILKKLPGVEVQENGAISVNGKPINKVLVEGGDLFGRNYTLGTKNIRAQFIEDVEIIGHFQENPVLKNVNFSEAIVLNLKLKEDKKNILSGTAHGGLGWGQEAKGALHANIFSISRKTKAILLSDNGNTGSHYGIDELEATYGETNGRDVEEKTFEAGEYIFSLSTTNPGLPAPFTDNAASYFSTLRALFDINDCWDAGLNITYAHREDAQSTTSEQLYAFEENVYQLDMEQNLRLRNLIAGGEAQLNYLSAQQDRSFQSHLEWGSSLADARQDFLERRPQEVLHYQVGRQMEKQEFFFTGLYSEKLSARSVGQLQFKGQSLRQPEKLEAENRDFPAYFGQEPGFSQLRQPLQHQQESLEMLGRYLWSSGPFSLEVEPAYTRTRSSLSVDWLLLGKNGDSLALNDSDQERQGVQVHRLQAALHLASQLDKRSRLKLMLQGTENRPEGFPARFVWTVKTELSTIFDNGATGRLQYTYEEYMPEDHWLLTLPYFSDNYLANQPIARNKVLSAHRILIGYNQREPLKLRSYYFNLRAILGQLAWQEEALFFQSILQLRPYLSDGNARLSLTGYFDQFIPHWRTSLTLRGWLSLAKRQYVLLDEPQEVVSHTSQLKLGLRTALWGRFHFGLENQLNRSTTFLPDESTANRNEILGWRASTDISYTHQQWRLSFALDRNLEASNNGRQARLLGARARLSRRLLFAGKEGAVELHAFNLFNASSFSGVQNDAYLFFRSSVEAIPRFLLLKMDWSL
ncbi:MAG: carboxypeptidase-like regulatory domain-containing protein [Phaeodactylibacter sp.]|nr:carboxypeptidase-like regulatory domain-containing protein [Phaeodactylibacter sp.]